MRISLILVSITMVAIAIEICKAKYILVDIDDAKTTGNVIRLNHTADLLNERKVTELAKENTRSKDNIVRDSQNDNKKCGGANSSHRLFRLDGKDANKKNCLAKCVKNEDCVAFSGIWNQWCIGCDVKLTTKHQGAIAFKKDTEWLTFMHVKREMYIGKPEIWNFPPKWDCGNINEQSAGKHMITDKDGNPLKLSEVKDGMKVKIVTKDNHFEGWQYLYTSQDTIHGNGHCYYDLFRDSAMAGSLKGIWMRQQTWIVKIDYSNTDRYGSFRFESNYWKNNYLNANEGKWLYVDNDENPWWRIYRA